MNPLLNQTPIYISVQRDNFAYDDHIKFYCTDGNCYTYHHEYDCCESVYIDDIVGNFDKLLYHPILKADEKSSSYDYDDPSSNLTNIEDIESATWTFYTFAGPKGYVDVRWIGESNGYYSESVDISVDPYTTSDLPSDTVEYLEQTYPEYLL
jgi:hypothetical protein